MSSNVMLLDQIWKRQLTLVTYGNAYLNQNLAFSRWINHSIFNEQHLEFRDLVKQHLLAQHFQVWLEGLKKQGVHRLSLHDSTLLSDEKNPNINVELLPYAHFIVSHTEKQKHAWICGKELAEWYLADQDFEAPIEQRSPLKHETFWRFELDKNLIKRIEPDFKPAQWNEIRDYLNTELFHQPWLQDCVPPAELHNPYTGSLNTESLALLPTDAQADFVHQTLHRFDAAHEFMQHQIQHPYATTGEILTPEQQQNLRQFKQKISELQSKFIVKAANHYQTAQVSPMIEAAPLATAVAPLTESIARPRPQPKTSSMSVIKLIVFIIVICCLAYYFGL